MEDSLENKNESHSRNIITRILIIIVMYLLSKI
jgi:hypothetical protein